MGGVAVLKSSVHENPRQNMRRRVQNRGPCRNYRVPAEIVLIVFELLLAREFQVEYYTHAGAILSQDFPTVSTDLENVLSTFSIPVEELVAGGGGEAPMTQRLRRALHDLDWKKTTFQIKKEINGRLSGSISHEVDHVKVFGDESIALEIEWNNKDPFFDRDLDNFHRLHAEGAIAAGVIVTRGLTFQAGIRDTIEAYAASKNVTTVADLERLGIRMTDRQRKMVERVSRKTFARTWAEAFCSDKFGEATTHWRKLSDRMHRKVGHPCPLLLIGIPLSVVINL
jgi:hypothetical protein